MPYTDKDMSRQILLWLLRVRPKSVRSRSVIMITSFVLVIGFYRTLEKLHTPRFVIDNKCVINEYVVPTESSHHPECFLQTYCLQYDLQPKNICQEKESVQLFVFIFSLPGNTYYRKLIRDTWLNETLFGAASVAHVFVLGYGESSNDTKIQEEAEIYNDILLIDIEESFCHLTLKAIAGLHFASKFCPKAKFVMKTDDDIFINMFLMQKKLEHLVNQTKTERVIMGLVWQGGIVFRTGRYAVSKLQYPESTYPPFCSGAAYIMSMDVTKLLYKLAMEDQSKALLYLDDPYITGILAHKAKLSHIQLDKLYLWQKNNYNKFTDDSLQKHLVLHLHDDHFIADRQISHKLHIDFWQRLVKLNGSHQPAHLTSYSHKWSGIFAWFTNMLN